MCIAAIRLEDVAALQLAQPSLGKMAVKEPAQPFWCYIPRLAARATPLLVDKREYVHIKPVSVVEGELLPLRYFPKCHEGDPWRSEPVPPLLC